MGGSRCTYRNCPVRSDGVVHMFHYPVFDRVRCHQWLVNAQRLDFLNLKLSQLRNRVICQHHFKDECFMNYKKEKLIFVAIPTEDGPFCEKSNQKALPSTQNDNIAKTFSIALNDIEENDRYSKSNSSVKLSMIYADFLTNGDAWEKQSLNETIWNNMVITPKENKTAKKKITIEWLNTDEEQMKEGEIQQPQITSTDLIENSSITKIDEFENPLLVHMSVIQNKDIGRNKEIKYENKVKNRHKTNKITSKEDSLLAKMPTNVVINQEQNFMLPDQDTNRLLHTQENTVVDLNNYVGADNIILQQNYNIDLPIDSAAQSLDDKHKIKQIESDTTHSQPLVKSMNDYCAIIENPKEYSSQVKTYSKESSNIVVNNNVNENQWEVVNLIASKPNELNVPKKSKIKILSEKTISDPVLVKGHLKPVSPTSIFVHVPKKISNSEIELEAEDTEIKELKFNEKKSNENIPPLVDKTKKADGLNNTSDLNVDSKPNEVVPKPPTIKHKIAPERVAAIEKKRNFNKRLRDIIEICLDKLDDQDKTSNDTKAADIPNIRNKEPEKHKEKGKSMKPNICSYLSKKKELSNTQEYNIINFLEARMSKMEDVLLGKIEQNSQKIVELKKTINQSTHKVKAASTQTSHDKESHKRHLYEEISSYLSPNANSLIYEELFINQYAPKISKQASSPKKRKRR